MTQSIKQSAKSLARTLSFSLSSSPRFLLFLSISSCFLSCLSRGPPPSLSLSFLSSSRDTSALSDAMFGFEGVLTALKTSAQRFREIEEQRAAAAQTTLKTIKECTERFASMQSLQVLSLFLPVHGFSLAYLVCVSTASSFFFFFFLLSFCCFLCLRSKRYQSTCKSKRPS